MRSNSPLVIAYHLVWTAYGWWLPNDPRGSCSREIRVPVLRQLGDLHYGRKRVQPASSDIRLFYEQATGLLKHPLIEFAPEHFQIVAAGFADAVEQHKYTCYACAILPDHVHLILRKHKHLAEVMIENLQFHSRLRLSGSRLLPDAHPIWCVGGWKIFLDHPDEVCRVIRYVEDNPLPYRLPRQRWDFVTQYDRWPLHPGHSASSPYVKRLVAAGRYPRDR